MKCVKLEANNIRGKISIPPSKSAAHRAIIGAALCEGESQIGNVFFSEDISATKDAVKNLGVEIEQCENKLIIKGRKTPKVVAPLINCSESGSTLRFLIPLALLCGEEAVFTGRGKLIERPLQPYYDIFEKQNIYYKNNNGCLPLTVKGTLEPDRFDLRGDVSSQFITGLMFILPLLKGDSIINITTELESRGYVDMTIDMLKKFSINIENRNYKEFYIEGNQSYSHINYDLEGDFSQAAFLIAAGLLGGETYCENINEKSFQPDKVIINIVKAMGGNIEFQGNSVKACSSKLKGLTIDVSQCPDIAPVLAVLGSVSSGTTKIINASRLRIKESDRLKAISTELNKLGAEVIEKKDSLEIKGKQQLRGGIVDSWNDHRIAMALAVASLKCTEPVIITNSDCVKKSYPHFFEDFKRLGGNVHECNMG